MTPNDVAKRLGVTPKRVREWLRANRPPKQTAGWDVDKQAIVAMSAAFTASPPSAPPVVGYDGRSRDEGYVLDLCDELLGEPGRRQHTFPWLTGDPNAAGARARLRVDGFYEQANVVVEYRERQHFEPVGHFDKPEVMTISGVHRGEQRRCYDARRDELIPAHGMTLWVLTPEELGGNTRGRLANRDRARDSELLSRAWAGSQERRLTPATPQIVQRRVAQSRRAMTTKFPICRCHEWKVEADNRGYVTTRWCSRAAERNCGPRPHA